MKMEKISDTQIKFFLTQADLSERDIRLAELAYGSEKIQNLFREMLDEAMNRFGIDFQNKPLMIEAIPVSLDSIMLVVTKVAAEENNLFGDFLERFQNRNAGEMDDSFLRPDLNNRSESDEKEFIYRFASLDDVIVAISFISVDYSGNSALFKYNGEYYLILDKHDNINVEDSLSEFGIKCNGEGMFKFYMNEHAEHIISFNAVEVLKGF